MKTILTPEQQVAATPIAWETTGLPLKRIAGFVMRNELSDPIGYWRDGKLYIYDDWRLRELQKREGVAGLAR